MDILVEEFYRDAEKYYMNFYGLFHKNLLSQKFEGVTTVANILLPEIANHFLIHHAKSGGGW